MKKLHLILATVLFLAQLPLAAFAAPAQNGPTLVPEEILHQISGGGCTSCHSAPEEPEPEHPERLGRAYWEHTSTRRVGYSEPAAHVDYEFINSTSRAITRTFSITKVESFNWSIGAGVPNSVVSASLGRSFNNTFSDSVTVTIMPNVRYQHLTSYPTSRYHYTFTRYQDWTDGTREVLATGTAAGSRTTTSQRHYSVPYN